MASAVLTSPLAGYIFRKTFDCVNAIYDVLVGYTLGGKSSSRLICTTQDGLRYSLRSGKPYVRITTKYPYVSIGISKYLIIDETVDILEEDHVRVEHRHGKTRFSVKRNVPKDCPAEPWVSEDPPKVCHAALTEIDTGNTYDITKVFEDILPDLRTHKAKVEEILPIFFEMYSIRYTPFEHCEIEVVMDDTFDTLRFRHDQVIEL